MVWELRRDRICCGSETIPIRVSLLKIRISSVLLLVFLDFMF